MKKNIEYKNQIVGRFFHENENPVLMLKSGCRNFFPGTRKGLDTDRQKERREERKTDRQTESVPARFPVSVCLGVWALVYLFVCFLRAFVHSWKGYVRAQQYI